MIFFFFFFFLDPFSRHGLLTSWYYNVMRTVSVFWYVKFSDFGRALINMAPISQERTGSLQDGGLGIKKQEKDQIWIKYE